MKLPKIPLTSSKGPGARYSGWQRSFESEFQALRADVAGLVRRLTAPTRPGVPCCYRASQVWNADRTRSFNVDVLQDGMSSVACNYVLRDAQAYDIPVKIDAEGVFAAKYLSVNFTQRLYDPTLGQAVQIPGVLMSYTNRTIIGGSPTPDWTTKFSLFPRQPYASPQPSRFPSPPAVNFFWNTRDDRSGRWASETLLPAAPLGFNAIGYSGLQYNPPTLVDGDLFLMPCPWLFERDSSMTFRFLPVTPVIQYDSSIAGNAASPGPALAFDDREGGIRNQAFTLHVELHGYRYKTAQDAIRAGALTRY